MIRSQSVVRDPSPRNLFWTSDKTGDATNTGESYRYPFEGRINSHKRSRESSVMGRPANIEITGATGLWPNDRQASAPRQATGSARGSSGAE